MSTYFSLWFCNIIIMCVQIKEKMHFIVLIKAATLVTFRLCCVKIVKNNKSDPEILFFFH